ncbi:Gfo/Idh/MocA family protein [Paraburkholderia sp. RL17-337-BIB-A]|uniref:Gfo/Idh/MocA family protein n=1 Tax=Paraburkholderia sp. RL17-337-BIB-A TaxID=3031636 RepID=UPI0038BCCC93
MTRRLGVVMVGLGPGSQPHLHSLADLRDIAELRWAVCREPDTASLGPLAGTVKPTSNLAAALADPAVNVAIVATPASTHYEVARQCLDAGKHTLVEKPLEISLQRAEQLVKYAEQSIPRFGVVLQHRFRPGSIKLRALLAEGRLGEIQNASVKVPWWRPQSYYDEPGRGTIQRDGGGVLLTQAIHAIDLFRSLVGVKSVEAAQVTTTAIHKMETEDYVNALLTLGNGAPGFLTATTTMYPGQAESIDVVGTKATATLCGGELNVFFHDGETITIESDGRSGGGASIMDFSHEPHCSLISDFLDSVSNGRSPIVTGSEALETHRLIDTILQRGEKTST